MSEPRNASSDSLLSKLALRGRLRSPGQRGEARPAITVFDVSARRERADAPCATHMRQSQQAQPIRTGHYDVTPVKMHDAEGLAIESGGRRRIVEQHHIAALRVQRFDLRNAVLGGELLDYMLQRRRVLANPPHGRERRVFALILAAKRGGEIDPGHRLDVIAHGKGAIMLAPGKRLRLVRFDGMVKLRLPTVRDASTWRCPELRGGLDLDFAASVRVEQAPARRPR